MNYGIVVKMQMQQYVLLNLNGAFGKKSKNYQKGMKTEF